jgi:hypothetical protein
VNKAADRVEAAGRIAEKIHCRFAQKTLFFLQSGRKKLVVESRIAPGMRQGEQAP